MSNAWGIFFTRPNRVDLQIILSSVIIYTVYKKLLDNSKERYPFWKHWKVNSNITSSKSTSFFTVRVRAWPPTELPVEFSSSFHLPRIAERVRAVDRGVWRPGVVYSSGRTRQKWLWYEARPLPPLVRRKWTVRGKNKSHVTSILTMFCRGWLQCGVSGTWGLQH